MKGEDMIVKYWLWAMPQGKDDRLHEQPLTSFPLTMGQASEVMAAATKDGWHGFRFIEDDNKIPDFVAAVKKGEE